MGGRAHAPRHDHRSFFLFREFRSSSRIITNYALGKVRSEAFCRGDPAGKRSSRDLGGGWSLNCQYEHVRKLPELSFTSIAQVLTTVNLLTKAWASAGACIVDSKATWNHATSSPERVWLFHLETAMWYDAFINLKAVEFMAKCDEARTVSWLLDCHRKSVNKAKTLYIQGWP